MFAKLGQKASIVVYCVTLGCVTSVTLAIIRPADAKDLINPVLVFLGGAIGTFVTLQMAGESITGGKTSTTAQSAQAKAQEACPPAPADPAK